MKKSDAGLALLVLMAGAAAVFYYQRAREEPPQILEIPERGEVQPLPQEAVSTSIRYPIPDRQQPEPEVVAEQTQQTAEPEPLPALDESDTRVRKELEPLFDGASLETHLQLQGIIRRFVVTIDNLPRAKLPRGKYLSARRTAGRFLVTDAERHLYLDTANFPRYTPFVQLAASVDSERLVALYFRLYPLFQQAYEDIGYPSAYFNDRLIEVMDHLLATPDTDGPIRLIRPHVLYRFADPQLEALSSGQKVLVRIGPEHAATLKAKLREIRRALLADSGHGEQE